MAGALPDIRWRRSRRARRLRIALCPWRGAELVLPPGVSQAQGQAFLDSRRGWMERAWQRLRAQVPEAFETEAPRALHLPALERHWRLAYCPSLDALQEGEEVLSLPGRPCPQQARHLLKPWLMARARRVLPSRVRRLSERTGLDHARVQIRDQKTRWGSCSRRGTISLNFRILFHRPRVVDYLILHELCHTRHMNHGPKFRALLAGFEPDWHALDRALSRGSGGVPGWLGW